MMESPERGSQVVVFAAQWHRSIELLGNGVRHGAGLGHPNVKKKNLGVKTAPCWKCVRRRERMKGEKIVPELLTARAESTMGRRDDFTSNGVVHGGHLHLKLIVKPPELCILFFKATFVKLAFSLSSSSHIFLRCIGAVYRETSLHGDCESD
ncbi:hypothetical protein K440DRAFT_641185 [Wilcoxina mikolae CBS 423.85]|nr:hypothetical protein K440DRAFT_641185 [Wilcoxina mikolae CBS 423.85]